MMTSPWYSPPHGSPYRILSFRSKRELYSFLVQNQLERERSAYINGAIMGRAITIQQINHAQESLANRRVSR
jgi:hypothetical protein